MKFLLLFYRSPFAFLVEAQYSFGFMELVKETVGSI